MSGAPTVLVGVTADGLRGLCSIAEAASRLVYVYRNDKSHFRVDGKCACCGHESRHEDSHRLGCELFALDLTVPR